jgi:chitinase
MSLLLADFMEDSVPTSTTSAAPTTYTSFVPQCRWSNCGEGCGDGWTAVPRSSSGTKGENIQAGETMQESSWCGNSGWLRQFCCPVDYPLPTCAWYNFNNGKCSGGDGCPSGMVEVGSFSGSCSNSYSGGYENACCTTNDVTPMAAYSQCEWNGQPGHCNTASIPAWPNGGCFAQSYAVGVASTDSGSGAVWCGVSNHQAQTREYCCTPQSPTVGQYVNCGWYDSVGNTPPGWSPETWCYSGCPDNKVKVGLSSGNCFAGAQSWCCEADYNLVLNAEDDPEYLNWAAAVADVESNSYTSCITRKRDPSHADAGNSIERRGNTGDAIFLAQLLVVAMTDGTSTPLSHAGSNLWNSGIVSVYPYLTTANLQQYIQSAGSAIDNLANWANQVICDFPTWNQNIEDSLIPAAEPTCFQWNLSLSDPDFWVGDDDYADWLASGGFGNTKRGLATLDDGLQPWETTHELVKRVGGSRTFTVLVGLNAAGVAVYKTLISAPYPNGQNGGGLIAATGSAARYNLADVGDCISTIITGSAPEGTVRWVGK